jgi:hypothetical protein
VMTPEEVDSIWFLVFNASSQAGGGEYTVGRRQLGREGCDDDDDEKDGLNGARDLSSVQIGLGAAPWCCDCYSYRWDNPKIR